MFGIGMPELLIILGLALVILGPKKLPDIAKGLGRAMREFRKATDEMKESLQEETEELGAIKDTLVEEIDRAAESEEDVGDTAEEAGEPEKDSGATGEDTGAGKAVEDAGNTDEVNHADSGKESTQEEERTPPG